MQIAGLGWICLVRPIVFTLVCPFSLKQNHLFDGTVFLDSVLCSPLLPSFLVNGYFFLVCQSRPLVCFAVVHRYFFTAAVKCPCGPLGDNK